MAEYIDKNKIGYIAWSYPYYNGKISMAEINRIPIADVVEREKIEQAIEEIKQEIQNGTIKITDGNERLFNILKEI